MILKGSQRGGAKQLGRHLLNRADNEHVEVHEVRGFMADDLLGALQEAEAVSRGTRCKQPLFSVSLNPPETESVRVDVFEGALAAIEERNGLTGQPRVVVFHEKEGRRHCHAVWSRIDAETMTARNLPFFKTRLREVSKQLYLENGWQMPRGFIDSAARDPRNFSLAEWQQAKRTGHNARDLKAMIQECWAVSDNRASFAKALEERGLYLAKGDRRAHVALTYDGEVVSVPRMIGKKAKEVAARLGNTETLASVDQTRQRIASTLLPRLHAYRQEARAAATKELEPLNAQRRTMQAQHAEERRKVDEGQKARVEAEQRERAERTRKGLMGLWDRLTGTHAKIQKQNEMEAYFSLQRDREQRHALIAAQLRDRQGLQQEIRHTRARHAEQLRQLHKDAANYRLMQKGEAPKLKEAFDRTQPVKPVPVAERMAESPAPQPLAPAFTKAATPEIPPEKPSRSRPSAEARLERLRQRRTREPSRDRGNEPDLER